jgi:hypothetical protein
MIKNKKLVRGVGLNDLTIKGNGNEDAYSKWSGMLERCYDPKSHIKFPTYIGCSVCDEWLIFSKFKDWHDKNYIVGLQLDKDILIRCNKIYGPEYCRFVPQQINKLLNDRASKRGKYKQGVYFNRQKQKFVAQIKRGDNKNEYIGTFDIEQEAFDAYKIEKEKWIKHQADHYFSLGQIDKDIHTALYNWSV